MSPRMYRFGGLSLAVALASYGVPATEKPEDRGVAFADKAGIPVSRRYFPPASEQPKVVCDNGRGSKAEPIVDEFEDRWFSRHLAAAREPSIYLLAQQPKPSGLSALRFTWLRTFHSPVVIRAEERGEGSYWLVAKELSGAGGYDPGNIKRSMERKLSRDEMQRLRQLLARNLFFQLRSKDCALGCDGSVWIFESLDQQGYHLLTRWSPDDGPVREVGEFMLTLTGWKFDEQY